VRPIEVELTQNLTDSIEPGKIVTVTGIMRIRKVDGYGVEARDNKFYIKAVSMVENKNMVTVRKSSLSQKDMKGISLIRSEPSPFRTLVLSLCPEIIGHELPKAGLLLGLFGGSGLWNSKRHSEIHVLVVGDPGLGKSKMLQRCAEVSPRGTFVCGNSTTSTGLAANISLNGSIDAGALALADQGSCCIDEFDKISNAYHCLLEVMEQQMITIMKTGVKSTLNARTSILAAANPVGGYYDKSKTVMENLKIPRLLLSRFDLVYVLLDRPDHVKDMMIANRHQNPGPSGSGMQNFFPPDSSSASNRGSLQIGGRIPIKELLKSNGEEVDLVPISLLQTYIGYAKEHCVMLH
jgi:DNA helicase MCM8